MNITMLLAQIWGPIILAIGLGFFVSRSSYIRLYKDIQKEPLAVLSFGIFSMVIGILHISIHNAWGSFPQGLVSLLGWGTLMKGVLFIVAPRFVDKAADWEVSNKLVPSAGALILIVGIYLSYIGYFI